MSLSEASQERLAAAKRVRNKGALWVSGVLVFFTVLSLAAVGWYWSREPAKFDVIDAAAKSAGTTNPKNLPAGYIFANTLTQIGETLLYKPGGYITNDITPPSLLLDNIKNWEYGALVMLRDAATALRNNFSRSQSQSKEDPDLSIAEPLFYHEHDRWIFPATESKYEEGISAIRKYMDRLASKKTPATSAGFFARGDNLSQYLQVVEKRLGDLSYRLSASTLSHATYALDAPRRTITTITPWLEVDDIFFEARGASWALFHIMKAVATEFSLVLEEKRAMETVQRIIHELEDAQTAVISPVILNGDGFGLFANYSLTMANYITRANAATLDLRDLMARG